jgi:hypothetical protein
MRTQGQNTLYARQKVNYLFKLQPKAAPQRAARPSWRTPIRRIRHMLKK